MGWEVVNILLAICQAWLDIWLALYIQIYCLRPMVVTVLHVISIHVIIVGQLHIRILLTIVIAHVVVDRSRLFAVGGCIASAELGLNEFPDAIDPDALPLPLVEAVELV